MDFRKRLQMATERGQRTRTQREQAEAAAALSEEEYKRLHSNYRRELIEHIEKCLAELADNFPGFAYEDIMSEEAWGGSLSRDDLRIERGRRNNMFSRLQVVVGKYNSYRVLDISAKGTIANRENFSRQHYRKLDDTDLDDFRQLIERWVLDYAEQYATAQ